MLSLTDQNFSQELSEAKKPVLVDWWALWCAPCQILGPIFENMSRDYGDRVVFAKANLDSAPFAAQKYGVDRIPVLILFQGEKETDKIVGLRPEPQIKQWLENNLERLNENSQESPGKDKMEQLIRDYEEIAKSRGLKLNPDRELVSNLIRGLIENEKRYGARYCPCRRVSGDKKEDEKLICPCDFYKQEIQENGWCHCRLFKKAKDI